jgi:hypothetical protein
LNRSTFDGFHSDSDTVSKSEEELQLAGNSNNRLTKFQKDIITAVWQAKQPNFDGEREFEDPLGNKQNQYTARLAKKRTSTKLGKRFIYMKAKQAAPQQPKTTKQATKFDPSTHQITINEKILWKVLKQNKVRWTRVNRSHPCPLHDHGPVWEEELKQTVLEILDLEQTLAECRSGQHSDGRSREKHQEVQQKLNLLKSLQRELQPKVDKYKLHLKQYETCRQHVKQIENDLKKSECLVYRDSVRKS